MHQYIRFIFKHFYPNTKQKKIFLLILIVFRKFDLKLLQSKLGLLGNIKKNKKKQKKTWVFIYFFVLVFSHLYAQSGRDKPDIKSLAFDFEFLNQLVDVDLIKKFSLALLDFVRAINENNSKGNPPYLHFILCILLTLFFVLIFCRSILSHSSYRRKNSSAGYH